MSETRLALPIRHTALTAGLLAALVLLLAPGRSEAVTATEVLANGGFEGAVGTPLQASSWTSTDSVFGTPICSAACVPAGGSQTPRSGVFWAWLGGASSGSTQTGSVQQALVIPRGRATLTFYFWLNGNTGGGTLSVTLDGTSLFAANDGTAGFSAYAPVVRDVSQFANGATHTLKFDYADSSTAAGITNMLVDDVSIQSTPAPVKCKKKKHKKSAAAAKKCKKKKKKK